MCSLSPIADMIRAALEFVGGSASRPANSLPSPLPQARAGTLWAMGRRSTILMRSVDAKDDH
jgi:hypothetical protein